MEQNFVFMALNLVCDGKLDWTLYCVSPATVYVSINLYVWRNLSFSAIHSFLTLLLLRMILIHFVIYSVRLVVHVQWVIFGLTLTHRSYRRQIWGKSDHKNPIPQAKHNLARMNAVSPKLLSLRLRVCVCVCVCVLCEWLCWLRGNFALRFSIAQNEHKRQANFCTTAA